MICPICDQKTINCDCTTNEKSQHMLIAELEESIADSITTIEILKAEIVSLRSEVELARGYRDEAEAESSIASLAVERMRLTDTEREAVLSCIADDVSATAYDRADTLRGMLERLGGGR